MRGRVVKAWASLLLLGTALAGGGAPVWRAVTAQGQLVPAGEMRFNRPCPPLQLPAIWHVQDQVYADVTGDGQPECLLVVWRPWRDWPTRRWQAQPSPIAGNHDAAGLSAQLALLRPLGGGHYRERWVGSALYQPVTALTALPGGQVAALETSYGRGRLVRSLSLSVWSWTGFGFRLEERLNVHGRTLALDVRTGRPAVR